MFKFALDIEANCLRNGKQNGCKGNRQPTIPVIIRLLRLFRCNGDMEASAYTSLKHLLSSHVRLWVTDAQDRCDCGDHVTHSLLFLHSCDVPMGPVFTAALQLLLSFVTFVKGVNNVLAVSDRFVPQLPSV